MEMLARAIMLAVLFMSLLVRGSCYRVGGQFIRQLITFLIYTDAHSSYFIVIWFHFWTRVC